MNRQPHTQVREIDDTEDRMGSIEQLDFSDRQDERQGRAGDTMSPAEQAERYPAERVREAGMSGGEALGESRHEDGVTQDDLSPDTLIDESGARGPHEPGQGDLPADEELSLEDARDVGLGGGLDEAEEGRLRPLDGEPWNDPEQPLRADNEPSGEALDGIEQEQGISPSERQR